jgi:hypothetical protein
MNKYEQFSKAKYADLQRARACLVKKSFATEAEARKQGPDFYQCFYCGGYHVFSGVNSVLGILKGKGRTKPLRKKR